MPKQKTLPQPKEGVIVRFNDDAGFCYIRDEKQKRQFIFGYDKIKGYAGQRAQEMHLNEGRHVQFTLEDDEIIKSVDLV